MKFRFCDISNPYLLMMKTWFKTRVNTIKSSCDHFFLKPIDSKTFQYYTCKEITYLFRVVQEF